MAVENLIWSVNAEAGADLSAKRGYAVEIGSTGTVTACNGATDVPYGILLNAPVSGEDALIGKLGIASAIVAAASPNIAIGDWLGTGAAGKLVKKSTNNDLVCARALEAATADDVFITVELFPPFSLGA